VLIPVTLIVMMLRIGLGVAIAEVVETAANLRLVTLGLLANYICVPALTVALLLALHVKPMVSVRFLTLAVCPGAPFGPPLTSMAKGNVGVSVGLMVILAGASAILAPLLLGILACGHSENGENIAGQPTSALVRRPGSSTAAAELGAQTEKAVRNSSATLFC